MSGRRLKASLESINVLPEDLDAILITHEHSDHIQGTGILSRRYNLPIYATNGTAASMDVGKIGDGNLRIISADRDFQIGTIGILPFTIPHDAAEPVGYNLFIGSKKCTLATDMGHIDSYIMDHLKGSSMLILESNHDVDMLKNGSYPYHLKRRILGVNGHLSNSSAADAIPELVESGTEHIMLGHLSRENNLPEIAMLTARNALHDRGIREGQDVTLAVAGRSSVTRFAGV